MEEAFKKRGSHTEEATVPGFNAVNRFATFLCYFVIVNVTLCSSYAMLILELPLGRSWSS